MLRKSVVVRRLIAIGSVSALLGLAAGGCASGGQVQTPNSGGAGVQEAGGGQGGGAAGGAGGSDASAGGTGGGVDGGDAGGAVGDASVDGDAAGGAGGKDGGSDGASGASGAAGAGGCASRKEICNGFDDNCNGLVDEGDPGGGDPCTVPNAKGQCALGTKHCTNGVITCVPNYQPQPEKCDGLDNNCDGQTDEGNPGGNQACATGKPGICSTGTTACVKGKIVCDQNYSATAEKCNGLDDNCNGQTDEGDPGGGASCTVSGQKGICAIGVMHCTANGLQCVQQNTAQVEKCDGLDDNCNGQTDETYAQQGQACNTGNSGICAAGTYSCAGGKLQCNQTNTSTNELCNGLDDNCNGQTDEDTALTMCARNCQQKGENLASTLNGTLSCNGSCQIKCNPSWYNSDGDFCNGCENQSCAQTPSTNTCGSTYSLSVTPTSPASVSGQIITLNKSVYYTVSFATAVVNAGYKPQIVLSNTLKTEYQMDVLSSCSGGETPIACPTSGGPKLYGTNETYLGNNIQSWSMDFAADCQASPYCGSNGSTIPGSLIVKISRIGIPAPSSGDSYPECDQFHLNVTE